MRAIIYLRQSKDREGNELAIERQRAECQRLCRSRGWTVADEVVENNRSASKSGRPGFKRVVYMLEQKASDCVVVLRIDRLFRLNDELETLIDLSERLGGRVATVEGDIDLATPSGRLVARLLVSVARAEMETKSARHKLANRQQAEAGIPHSSKRPYGYAADRLRLHPVEGPILQRMGQMILSGHSYRDIAWWLNEHGHLTTGGCRWTALTVRKLLEKPRYGGLIVYDGIEHAGQFEAAFDLPIWRRLQAEIAARRTGTPGDGSLAVAKKYLLTGIATCGKCGMHLSGHQRRDVLRNGRQGEMFPRYICRSWGDKQKAHGCGGIRRHAIPMDHFIREAIIYRLDSPELGAMLEAQTGENHELTKLMDSRAEQQRRKDQLVKDYATGLLTAVELAYAKSEAQTALDTIDAQIAELGRSSHASGLVSPGRSVRSAWMANTLDWRRRLIQLLISDITVLPSLKKPAYDADGVTYRFDASAVRITWVDAR